MTKLKFIHAADLHIESPYRGFSNMNPALGDRLIKLGFNAFDNLIHTCIEKSIDFLLIAGDSFDSSNVSLSAQYRFIRGLQKLSDENIPVYIVCGNHDPLISWIKSIHLPSNVHVFPGNEVSRIFFEKENEQRAHIYGVSFEEKEENRSLADQFKVEDQNIFSIGLLHGTFAGREHNNPYCPMTMEQLQRSGMHYWALGHIHKREIINEQSPTVVYSGNLQGRHFNETGEKGVYYVEVDNKNKVNPTFIALSEMVFLRENIVLNEEDNLTTVIHKIETLKEHLLDKFGVVMLRLTLTGNTNVSNVLSDTNELAGLVDTLNDSINYNDQFVYLSSIENDTSPIINWEERMNGDDFVADLMRRYEKLMNDDDLQKEVINQIKKEINSSSVFRKIKKYNLEDKLDLSDVFHQAKVKSISELIATKSDHQ
jgi:DNA repair exonuclease SbcCD nuclease subunit